MVLRDLRLKFKDTLPISDGFFELMKKSFGFYSTLCNEFFASLGSQIESNAINNYLQTEIRPRLFNNEHCKTIEKTKKAFLAENIKLEQFLESLEGNQDLLNDLNQLKKVSEAIYELLQTHWEFYKYEKSVASNEAIIAFLLEIHRIGTGWDIYLEKYLAVSNVLKTAYNETQKDDFSPLVVCYHIPQEADFTFDLCTNLIGFLKESFEFVLKVYGKEKEEIQLEITNINVGNPIYCEILVPTPFIESFQRFLGYLSVDVLKRETLVKFVMEIVRLQQGKEIAKTAITNFQKKIAKQLNLLHPEGYFSINEQEAEDSVNILTSLCAELEKLDVDYKDMLTGSTSRLARNKGKKLSELSLIAKKIPKEEAQTQNSDSKDKQKGKDTPIEVAPSTTNKDNLKKVDKKDKESTVKIDVKKKEHIQYLTS